MDIYHDNPFVFSPRYRIWRHLFFWLVHIVVFTYIFKLPSLNFGIQLFVSAVWVPVFIMHAYPVMYWFIPQYLLKEKYSQFVIIMLLWAVAGWFWNYVGRVYISIPFQETLGTKNINRNPWGSGSFLAMSCMTGFGSMIVLFKYWIKKQNDFLIAEKEKVQVELQLLKAQVHPHFLFNTLNNIYSFSLEDSPRTAQMVIKLSSLLSYMLYDCKANEVLLEKEIEIMKNYIDLEKERYANRLEISINIEGDIRNQYIAPLLLLPFLENAFKHGTSEQLEKPWLSMDISVKQNILRCKIINSKNEIALPNENGIGVQNVKKRLAYLYAGNHELKLTDEGSFFIVSLSLELKQPLSQGSLTNSKDAVKKENITA